MQKPLFLLLLFVLAFHQLQAKEIEGTIIDLNNDTLQVTFEIPIIQGLYPEPNFYRLQYMVEYWDSTGVHKSLYPTQVKEIAFHYSGKTHRMLARHNPHAGYDSYAKNYMFLKLEVEGPVKAFTYFNGTTSSASMYNNHGPGNKPLFSNIQLLLEKENHGLIRIRNNRFKTDIQQYFQDCPALVAYVMQRKLNNEDLETIVHRYNSSCLAE